MHGQQTRHNVWIEIAILAALAVAIVALVAPRYLGFLSTNPVPVPEVVVNLSPFATKGQPTAAIGVVEYSDVECPYCRRFALETEPILDAMYVRTGKVLWSYKHLVSSAHPHAASAAQAADCAAAQLRFWPMHRLLFQSAAALDTAGLMQRAGTLGLDTNLFERCMQSNASSQVKADIAEARRLGIASTPTFAIGSMRSDGALRVQLRLDGAVSFIDFQRVLESLLGQATTR